MNLEIINISKRFNDFVALDDVSLTVRRGELVAFLGPSGSGKTTLLRIIAGLEQATEGEVRFDHESVVNRSIRHRRVGFCFQHYALFKHMSVFDNVAFGLRVKRRKERPSKEEIRARVLRLLQLVQLEPFVDRYPTQLSGGQRQRVALARALAIEPAVLLLDEPFGALDAKVRKELRRWLRQLHDEMQLTSVFVTHDQEEALELADRVVLMNRGRIEQMGPPHDVYDHPATAFAYEFLGHVNRLPCHLDDGKVVFPGGELEVPSSTNGAAANAVAYVRPHDVEVFGSRVMVGTEAVVRYVSTAGPFVKVELAVPNSEKPVEVDLSRDEFRKLHLEVGKSVFMRVRKARVFGADGDVRFN
jgi:sulfate/thiosulfate transport system ATP-binding protein